MRGTIGAAIGSVVGWLRRVSGHLLEALHQLLGKLLQRLGGRCQRGSERLAELSHLADDLPDGIGAAG